MKLKLTKEEELDVCECGGAFKLIFGFRCLDCLKSFENYDSLCAEQCYGRLTCGHRRICPRCHAGLFGLTPARGIREHIWTQCESCSHKEPLNRATCKTCGRACWKQFLNDGTKFYYYCPTCDWQVRKLISDSGIPMMFRAKQLDDMEVTERNRALIQHIRDLGKNPRLIKTWMVLRGPSGAGKTEFACLALRQLARRHIPIRFFDLPSYLASLTALNDFDDERAPLMRQEYERDVLTTERVLLIDDLYDRQYGEREHREIYRLVAYRHSHLLPTIITTDMGHRRIAELLDERLSTRIKERAMWFIPGELNMRKQPA